MIDILLKILERKADEIHFDLDNNTEYLRVCAIVTAMDFHDPVTYDDKMFVRDALRDILFPAVKLDYEAVFRMHFETALP